MLRLLSCLVVTPSIQHTHATACSPGVLGAFNSILKGGTFLLLCNGFDRQRPGQPIVLVEATAVTGAHQQRSGKSW